MKKLLLLLALLSSWAVNAQSLETYSFTTGVNQNQWINLSDNATQIINSGQNDACSGLNNVGFPFRFGNGTYTRFWANSNGIFSFNDTPSTVYTNQFNSTNCNNSQPKICGISRNMGTGSNGYVRYELTGTAPNRVLVCEFKLSNSNNNNNNQMTTYTARVMWQVQLHEADGKVVMVYGTAPNTNPTYYQIGISQSGSDIWTINPKNHVATHSTVAVGSSYAGWPGAYRYYAFEPPCCPSPLNLTCTATSGSVDTPVTATFTWTNGGEETQWMMEYDTNEDFSTLQQVAIQQSDLVNGTYTLTGLTADVQYYGRIKAWCPSCNNGEGTFSEASNVCLFKRNVLPKPENITFSGQTLDGITVSWTAPNQDVTEYRYRYSADNGTTWSALESTTATTVTLNGLPYEGHVYTFQVQAVYSDGASAFNSAIFHTQLCLPENRCQISLELTDLYGDGWRDNYLKVVDAETDELLGTFTNTDLDLASGAQGCEETQTFTLLVCDGRDVRIEYEKGSYPEDVAWVITDVNGEIIWALQNPTASMSMNYTVSCAPVTCTRPDNLQAVAVAHSAAFTWTDGEEGQNAWQVSYSTDASFNPDNGTIVSLSHVNNTIDGLAQNTTYHAYVRAYCGAEDGYSRWSGLMATFTTIAGNLPPTNVTVAAEPEMTQTSATLTWEGKATNVLHQSYDLYYSTESILPETLNTANLITGISSNVYTIETLTPGTTYTVWVRDNCGDDGFSTWSAPMIFSTIDLCPTPTNLTLVAGSTTYEGATIEWEGTIYNDNYVVEVGPYDFSATPTQDILMTQIYGLPNDWTHFGDGIVATQPGTAHAHVASQSIIFSSVSEDNVIVLPHIGTATHVLDISYWEAAGDNNSGEFEVGYVTEDNDTITFHALHTSYSSQGTSYQFVGNISFADAPIGARIAFRHRTVNTSSQWYLDDITVYERQYPAIWATEGYAPDVNSTGTFTIHGLHPSTLYKARVKSDCGDNGESTGYSNEVSFITAAGQPVTFTKEITGYGDNNGGYYLIASPLANYINPAGIENMTEGAFDLYYYDQSEELEWRNYETSHFNLESGKGYLYAHSSDVTLTFTGEPYTGDGTVTLDYDENADLPGWNLIGNPFGSNATLDRPYYRLNEDGSALKTETESTAVEAMEGVFVQTNEAGQTATFMINPGKAEPIAQTNIILKNSKGRSIDNAIVRFDNGAKLGKFQMNVNSPKLYISENGQDYAVVNASEVGELPLCFKANTDGSYTLNFDIEEVSFSYLHLIDNKTGMDVDLLASTSYTFDARTTDYASRFRLLFATGSSISSETDTFGFVNAAGNLCIFGIEGEAVLQVVDLTGRVISSSQFSGSYEQKLNVAPGMYMLRLINGNEVRTQKTILSSK